MIKIRKNVFETNSSSVHTITICSLKEFNEWENGNLYYRKYNGSFCTKEEIINKLESQAWFTKYYEKGWLNTLSNEDFDEFVKEEEYLTYEKFCDRETCYEYYEERYTTEHGDEIVVFGEYGENR